MRKTKNLPLDVEVSLKYTANPLLTLQGKQPSDLLHLYFYRRFS